MCLRVCACHGMLSSNCIIIVYFYVFNWAFPCIPNKWIGQISVSTDLSFSSFFRMKRPNDHKILRTRCEDHVTYIYRFLRFSIALLQFLKFFVRCCFMLRRNHCFATDPMKRDFVCVLIRIPIERSIFSCHLPLNVAFAHAKSNSRRRTQINRR